jgi:hypothetical protein
MFKKKYNIIIAVHNDAVCWISADDTVGGGKFFRLPLDQVLNDEKVALQMPDWLKGNHKSLCIVPDHWFGSQSYAFQSRKPSLIEPFLERKLAAAFPGQEAIRHFFNYRHEGGHKEQNLFALFFQEDKGYQLYTVLCRLNHCPGHITAPAFLWEERLGQVASDFSQQGTLLIHLTDQECHLYFYFKGHYQFSRSVMVLDAGADLDALGFEINQSLYMFSQKAKSDLERIYMLGNAPQCQARLGEILGRDIIDLKPLAAEPSDNVATPEIAVLEGLLHKPQMGSGAHFFGVMHRQVKRAMEWRPVQWAGIVLGLLLLIGLGGEHFALQWMHAEALNEYRTIQHNLTTDTSGMQLTEYADTLEQVLGMARRAELAEAAFRMPADFPAQVHLKQLDLRFESAPTLQVTALVQARSVDELQSILNRLIVQMKDKFKSARAITLNDIDIGLDQPGDGKTADRYQIAFQLELT